MQSRDSKHYSPSAHIRVAVDKGTLRLQFSAKISRQFYDKKQFYKGLGRSDTPENRQWAEDIARRIQGDIDHPDGLFDPTLQKYLEIKACATVTMLPTAKAQPKLGELWEEFIEWKYQTGQLSETTYTTRFKKTLTRKLEKYAKRNIDRQLADEIFSTNREIMPVKTLKQLLSSLSEMCQRSIQQDKLTKDYFAGMGEDIKLPKKINQLSDEEDYKAFTKKERDIIVDAFRTSDKLSERHAASFIEFLFLTGCRTGEAFALRWRDIKWIKDGLFLMKVTTVQHELPSALKPI